MVRHWKVIRSIGAYRTREIELYCASGSPRGQVSTMLANNSNGSLLIALSSLGVSYGRISVGGEARLERLLRRSYGTAA
jgi:hypothetical protein